MGYVVIEDGFSKERSTVVKGRKVVTVEVRCFIRQGKVYISLFMFVFVYLANIGKKACDLRSLKYRHSC